MIVRAQIKSFQQTYLLSHGSGCFHVQLQAGHRSIELFPPKGFEEIPCYNKKNLVFQISLSFYNPEVSISFFFLIPLLNLSQRQKHYVHPQVKLRFDWIILRVILFTVFDSRVSDSHEWRRPCRTLIP